MAVSLKDVADLAGVSATTVSHVMNRTRYVKPETVERVHQALEELGYVNNSAARLLRAGRSFTVGVMVNGYANSFFLEILEGIESVLETENYSMIIGNAEGSTAQESRIQRAVREFASWQVDGVIVFGQSYRENRLLFQKLSCPVVCIETFGGEQADHVMIDGRKACSEAVKAMLASGGKAVGCIGGTPSADTSAERIEGYKTALMAAGIEPRENWIADGGSTLEGGYTAACRLLEREKIDSLLVCNNLMTLGCVKALSEKGKIAGKDIRLVGYDDDGWRAVFHPGVSSIRPPLKKMGTEAARCLVGRMQDPSLPIRKIMLSSQLILRGSEGLQNY